jgi:hypothetical protein
MHKFYLALVSIVLLLCSCQKSISDFDPSTAHGSTGNPANGSGSFVAMVDGKQLSFTVNGATLVRSAIYNEKRLDITGTSTDDSTHMILTLGEETAQGDAVTVKSYVLNAFPPDDPATPAIDESVTTQGFTTYGIAHNNGWLYNVFDENGSCTVSSCDASSHLVSATFETTLTDLLDASHVVKITAGKLTNIKYIVVN